MMAQSLRSEPQVIQAKDASANKEMPLEAGEEVRVIMQTWFMDMFKEFENTSAKGLFWREVTKSMERRV